MDKKIDNKLSFNKRIQLVKRDVFKQLTENKELDNVNGKKNVGYYSLNTIEKYLNPTLDVYDLDLDLEINKDHIVGVWYDCQGDSDKERRINIDFSRIQDVSKLQMMANIVQSEGAVKTYTRRYALSNILRLPSTEMIDGDSKNNSYKNDNNYNKNRSNQNSKNTQKAKKLSAELIKTIEVVSNKKGITKEKVSEFIAKKWNIKSVEYLTKDQFEELIKKLNTHEDTKNSKESLNKLNEKIKEEAKEILDNSNKEEKKDINKINDRVKEEAKKIIDETIENKSKKKEAS